MAAHDQECEREVKQEKKQLQAEVVTPNICMPRQEVPWKYAKALAAKAATDLSNAQC